jgi:hypothetical protein
MAKIKIEEVVYALDTQFKKALENTVKKTFCRFPQRACKAMPKLGINS